MTPTDSTNSLILVDPSARAGEAALDLIELGERVTLLLLLSGPASTALHQFAEIEGVSISEAADFYLAQVTERLRAAGALVTGLSVDGDDPVSELLDAAESTGAGRIGVPADTKAFGRRGLNELAVSSPVPVVIAPAA
jgi:hypothetical protein